MSIRFKFRSSVNFDTVDIEGRSSISIAELRSLIILQKKLNLCQDFDLVFSDTVSGQGILPCIFFFLLKEIYIVLFNCERLFSFEFDAFLFEISLIYFLFVHWFV